MAGKPRTGFSIRCLIFTIAIGWALPATSYAEEDELRFGVGMDNEFALLYRPDVSYATGRGAREYIPRFAATVDFGILDWLDLGLGFSMTLPQDSTAQGVTYRNTSDVDVSGSYLDILLPARVNTRYSQGGDFALVLTAEVGIAFVRWETVSAQPNDTYNTPPPLNIPRHPLWNTELLLRAFLGVDWRPATNFAIQVAPYVAHVGAGDWHIGVNVSPAFLIAVGQ